ncbi:DUF2075 domain-containing protein [Gemmatimonas groenlandica]|uniref:DUF2075 domain-containing protein n=1 Tax=Gemmatimonas groenlandica TaxID=2732249 RepID=A0A6M4IN74_9BACT|nr:DUF2075 domain-containing protein [Gemmatimonas groenlandica]QJR35219.1 DUF2075 domain-containing protein [Gemmatimonas groenlandica]
MIVYSADKRQFLSDIDEREIDEVIHLRYKTITGRGVGTSELRSWRESLTRMASVLRDDSIPPNVGIAIEFHIPQSSKRIDVTLTGLDDENGKNAVIVELKQWESATRTDRDAIVTTFVGGGNRELVHPSYQAWSYSTLLEGFNTAVHEGGIVLRPCAYLHNYVRDGQIDHSFYNGYISKAPLFLKGEEEKAKLRSFISTHVKRGDSSGILEEIEGAKIRPSKALADSLAVLMKGNPEFVLIDDQKTVFEGVVAAAKSASSATPRVVIVEGGPGTGKSVLAINLLSALTSDGLVCKYVSRNAAPRAVFQSKLTGSLTKTKYESLFGSSGSFVESTPNAFDLLIVDEAHRLSEKSGLLNNKGENQTKELIAAGKCTVFFIDEDQRVTLRDAGSKAAIRTFAESRGAVVEEYGLASQFRCSGSDGYLAWLDHVLDIRTTANTTLDSAQYDFHVFDSPSELHDLIEAMNTGNKSRMVAGYCWPWLGKKDPAVQDITIGSNYKRRWNLVKDGSLWIVSPDSVNEVGCVHTCQGLELDYVGVIIGPDLIIRDGRVLTVPSARAFQDKSLHGLKKLAKTDSAKAAQVADQIIKNTYRTLMTRGMKGCYIYCTDPETSDYFRSCLRRESPVS